MPKNLIAIDINDSALKLAKTFGASHVINPVETNIKHSVSKITKNNGCDRVIIATGNKIAIENAIELCSTPGECIQVGVPIFGEKISVDAYSLMHKRNLSGSLGGGTFPDKDIPLFIKYNKEGKINVKDLITEIFPFKKINDAINSFRSDMPGRVIIKF